MTVKPSWLKGSEKSTLPRRTLPECHFTNKWSVTEGSIPGLVKKATLYYYSVAIPL